MSIAKMFRERERGGEMYIYMCVCDFIYICIHAYMMRYYEIFGLEIQNPM